MKSRNADWDYATVAILPLLLSGSVQSWPNILGHTFYEAIGPMPELEESAEPYQESMLDRYLDSFFAAVERRDQLIRSAEIAIPLSASR